MTTGPVTWTAGSGMSCVCPPTTAAISARERGITVTGTVHRLAVAWSLASPRPMASRSTWRSSKGRTTPAMSWPCSWPLPATRTVSPGSARATAAAMAAARSSNTATSPRSWAGTSAAPASIVARIARGSSPAGVVGGQYGGVGEPGRGRAHRHPLVRVAVAAAAEHGVQLALGDLAQGAQDRFDGVRLVRVVDDGEVGLAGVDALQAAGDAGHRGDAVGGGAAGRSRRRPAR